MTYEEKFKKLSELADKYGTDKRTSVHNYIPAYAKYLPDTCRTFIEVGVAEGRSALMWSDFYGNDVLDLHILDLFINPDFISPRWCRNRGFAYHKGSQTDIRLLYTIKEQFQVVSEDASHNVADQQITFKHLFFNNVVPGGVYFLEDTHTSGNEFYWNDGVDKFEDTPLWVFKNFLETGSLRNKYFNEQEEKDFLSIIDTVDVCCDDKMIVITKQK